MVRIVCQRRGEEPLPSRSTTMVELPPFLHEGDHAVGSFSNSSSQNFSGYDCSRRLIISRDLFRCPILRAATHRHGVSLRVITMTFARHETLVHTRVDPESEVLSQKLMTKPSSTVLFETVVCSATFSRRRRIGNLHASD
jgi:hypothetical protein